MLSLFHRDPSSPPSPGAVPGAPLSVLPSPLPGAPPLSVAPPSAPPAERSRLEELAEIVEDEIEFTVGPFARLWEITGRNISYVSIQGTAVSVALHALALLLVAEITIPKELNSALVQLVALVPEAAPEEEELPPPELTLAPVSEQEHENALASLAESAAAVQTDTPNLKPENLVRDIVEEAQNTVPEFIEAPIEGFKLDATRPVAGRVGEEVQHVEGAVDRITHEIMTRLEDGPVLVIWMMDQSISLKDTHAEVAARMERVFREVGKAGRGREAALMNAVVGFGEKMTELQLPTGDHEKIVKAMKNIPIDESGIENVFTAVNYAVDRFHPLMASDRRQGMVVVWTDESGDDNLRLENAIQTCRRFAVPVFTVGPSSMFGRQLGTHAYTHPEDDQVYQIPVFRGPDTPYQERLKLPFWFDGEQHDTIRAGIGPYALTRLAVASGGAYFINDSAKDRASIRLEVMRPYLPAYTSAAEQKKEIDASPLRRAIMASVEVSHKLNFKGTPQLQFAPTGANYQDEMRDAQKTVAYNAVSMEQMLAPFNGGKQMEELYAEEKSPRWKAWYDYTYGRLLAMNVRNVEYNWACAEMKLKGTEFVNKQSNRWTFVPNAQIKMGTSTQKQADEARRLLTRCVEQNPGTPWETLALRELKNPFGFKVEESYVAPPPPPAPRPPAAANNPPPPPPTGTRVEQPKMLEKPKVVNLPKL